MEVAFDTSVLVGLLDPLDLWHVRAMALHSALKSAGFAGVYFDCVLAETISTTTRRLREKKRADEIEAVIDQIANGFPADVLTWVSLDIPDLYSEVLNLVRSSRGDLNFNDALIALACRDRQILHIASFDGGFDQVPWLRRVKRPGDLT